MPRKSKSFDSGEIVADASAAIPRFDFFEQGLHTSFFPAAPLFSFVSPALSFRPLFLLAHSFFSLLLEFVDNPEHADNDFVYNTVEPFLWRIAPGVRRAVKTMPAHREFHLPARIKIPLLMPIVGRVSLFPLTLSVRAVSGVMVQTCGRRALPRGS